MVTGTTVAVVVAQVFTTAEAAGGCGSGTDITTSTTVVFVRFYINATVAAAVWHI
jgi:hypothetical protein